MSQMSAKPSTRELEEGAQVLLDFSRFQSKSGVGIMPVAVQDVDTLEVLLIGYANREALENALRNKVATFWSVSRNELWVKGLTSGNVLELVDVRVNCEQNSLLYLVRPQRGGACHTRCSDGSYRSTCFYRRINRGQLEPLVETK